MRLERSCGDQKMTFDHIKLVQQGDMGRGDLRHEQVRIVWQEGISVRLCYREGFQGEGRDDAHLKGHATLFDHLRCCGDEADRPAVTGMGRSFEQGGPQGAWPEEAIVQIHRQEEEYGKRGWR